MVTFKNMWSIQATTQFNKFLIYPTLQLSSTAFLKFIMWHPQIFFGIETDVCFCIKKDITKDGPCSGAEYVLYIPLCCHLFFVRHTIDISLRTVTEPWLHQRHHIRPWMCGSMSRCLVLVPSRSTLNPVFAPVTVSASAFMRPVTHCPENPPLASARIRAVGPGSLCSCGTWGPSCHLGPARHLACKSWPLRHVPRVSCFCGLSTQAETTGYLYLKPSSGTGLFSNVTSAARFFCSSISK